MNSRWNGIILLVLSTALYSANTWRSAVYVLDEAKNAGCAMEMFQRNDWVIPTFNGELRTDKPPLHYHFMQIAYRLGGVNPFTARLFSILMGVATVMSVYFFVRRMLDEKTAWISGITLATSIQLAAQFHLAVPDPYLIFFLTFGLLSFLYANSGGPSVFHYGCYVSIALATLAKGPVALVFAGLIALIYLVWDRQFNGRVFRKIKLGYGVPIYLLIVVPWYWLVGVATEGEWLQQFLYKHNVGRFTSTMEGHGGFPLASLVIAVVALLPLSIFFPQALALGWRQKDEQPIIKFSLVAFAVIIIFFALSRTILPNYPEPALPFFSILLAHFLTRISGDVSVQAQYKPFLNAAVYAFVTMALPFIGWKAIEQDTSIAGLKPYAIFLTILTLGALLGGYWLWRGKVMRMVYAYCGSTALMALIFFYVILPAIDARNPVTKALQVMTDSNKPVFYYKDFNPAFVFASKAVIPALEISRSVGDSVSDTGYYLVTQKRYLPELKSLNATVILESKDLFESRTTVVLEK